MQASLSLPLLHHPGTGDNSSLDLHLNMTTTDDLPWPELGNVSRGATRGNQGQKGVLGAPDREGRCVLQLRVQPGVLAVKLNRQSSDWYRALDNEVNKALKLTKTYWRKARRRQDYDARADQDHMELHEWLQQLKDKTMSHLELLMQKGDIQGPPYTMPEDIEISFLRKFIERQANGIPHNPRLRNSLGADQTYPRDHSTGDSISPAPSDSGYAGSDHRFHERLSDGSSPPLATSSRLSGSPSLHNVDALSHDPNVSNLQTARNALARAQKDTQDAFIRYTSCLDVERQARQAVAAAEKRRDDLMGALSFQNPGSLDDRSRQSSFSGDDRRSPSSRYTDATADAFSHARVTPKPLDWTTDVQAVYPTSEPSTHFEDPTGRSRKHPRSWELGPPMGMYLNNVLQLDLPLQKDADGPYTCEDLTGLPPRKRMHHAMPSFDLMSTATLQAQNIGISS